MKKYRLTDQKTLLGVLLKLQSNAVTDPVSQKKYRIQNPINSGDLNQSVHFTIQAESGPIGKPSSLVAIMKDNKAEIRFKQVNPYQEELFFTTEILIEPLERSAKRANIENIPISNLQIGTTVDIGTILSLHGKTSIINQTLTSWQMHLEQILSNFGYFIKRVNIDFYYATDSRLMEALAQSKSLYFLIDSNKGIFHEDHGFYHPKKLGENMLRNLLDNYLVNNIKSVLVVPVKSYSGVHLGFFEITSNMPGLGNSSLQTDINGSNGLTPLLHFLTLKSEEFLYQMELSYTNQWKPLVQNAKIRDISEDGAGIGLYVPPNSPLKELTKGSPVSFQVLINQNWYSFFGSIRGIKASESSSDSILGIRVYQCDRPEGLSLLSAYASQLIGNPLG